MARHESRKTFGGKSAGYVGDTIRMPQITLILKIPQITQQIL
jgi:hypothetical protein